MGREHVVYTGVVIKYDDKIIKFTETTKVKFGNATVAQIQVDISYCCIIY